MTARAFPAGRWKVTGWGVGVGDFPGPVKVEWDGEARDVDVAVIRARASESWGIYAPVSISVARRLPWFPPDVAVTP